MGYKLACSNLRAGRLGRVPLGPVVVVPHVRVLAYVVLEETGAIEEKKKAKMVGYMAKKERRLGRSSVASSLLNVR